MTSVLPELVAAVLLLALIVYTLTGGADFGGGVWDLFAAGPRKAAQRDLIDRAIAPIWEANHVWLILIVVVLFVAVPTAFAAITTALHIPLVLLLIGIVLRGAAFVFRTYDPTPGAGAARWRTVFAISSVVSPIFLGVSLAGLVTGELRLDATQRVATDFFSAWVGPFPLLVGLFTLALVAWLAAVYLTIEAAPDRTLQRDFRLRALIAGALAGALAVAVLLVAERDAPRLYEHLVGTTGGLILQLSVAALSLGALAALWRERYHAARALAVLQVTLVIAGLGAAQWPYVILPDLTFAAALAPDNVVIGLLVALAVGLPILLAALAWLYRVFKRPDATPD